MINPRTTALLAVDLQRGILAFPPEEAVDKLVAAGNALAEAFRAASLPIIWIHATGLPAGEVATPINEPAELPASFSELDPRLNTTDEDFHVFKKRTWSAFPRTDLADYLCERGVTDVVLCGLATGAGVDSTARSAYDEGFNVHVVTDATFDPHPERHAATLEQDLPSYGKPTTIDEVLAQLSRP